MRINTNTAAMNTYTNLTSANASKSSSLAKLSSGLRINKAGDDAAGLSISEKMKNQISGMTQASRNAQDGISLIQTAEGALSETHSILNRMRDLTVQAGNGTNTDDDKTAIQKEITSLTKEVERIANDTEFNTKGLMNAPEEITANSLNESKVNKEKLEEAYEEITLTTVTYSGIDGESNRAKDLSALTAEKLDDVVSLYNDKMAVKAVEDNEITDAHTLTDDIDFNDDDPTAITIVEGGFDTADKKTNFVDAYNQVMGGTDSFAIIKDKAMNQADFNNVKKQYTENETARVAKETVTQGLAITNSQFETSDIKQAASNDFTFQIGANAGEIIEISIGDMTSKGLKIDKLDITKTGELDFINDKGETEKLSTTEFALKTIDSAIKSVSEERANLGATQNRLDHTVSNLATTKENLSEANSRITDVDMAEEMMSFTKSNILSQASTSMLAQANQMPQSVLSLLQ